MIKIDECGSRDRIVIYSDNNFVGEIEENYTLFLKTENVLAFKHWICTNHRTDTTTSFDTFEEALLWIKTII